PSAVPYQMDPALMPRPIGKWISEHQSWALHPETPLATRADMPHEMTREEIHSEIEEYGRSCRLAVMAGFDGIELHAPHGYLEHQFLSPRSNRRTDEYGGSLENRMRFVVETYEAARGAVGSAIAVGIRLSGDEHLEGGIGHEELKTVVKTLGGLGIDFLHMSDGSYEALKHFFPAGDDDARRGRELQVGPAAVGAGDLRLDPQSGAQFPGDQGGEDRHGLPGQADAGRP